MHHFLLRRLKDSEGEGKKTKSKKEKMAKATDIAYVLYVQKSAI